MHMKEALLVLGWTVIYITFIFIGFFVLFRALFSMQETAENKRWWKK